MLTTNRHRCIVLVVGFSLAGTACEIVPMVGPGATHVDGTENQPGPGEVVVAGDPPNATTPLVIQFVASEGDVVEETTARIPKGGLIEAGMPNLPGVMGLLVNGTRCEGDFALQSEMRTNVVVRVTASGCSVRTASIEPI
jgi:hypothetical protein